MIMKPKFRIGDRVRIIDTGEKLVVIDIGDSWREEDPFTYLLAGEMGRYDGGYSAWYPGDVLELVGCGIPAPVLRWGYVVNDIYSDMFGFRFTIRKRDGAYIAWFQSWVIGNPYETLGDAKAACQDYWQQLWDKEMLISRDLSETGE